MQNVNTNIRFFFTNIKALLCLLTALVLLTSSLVTAAQAAPVRIKDIVDFEGVRDNQLLGYGLVVGLNGTGDAVNNTPFTERSIISMLERLGVSVIGQQLNTRNVAAVVVTANLPAFATSGSRIDVTVSTLGDAASLQGGTLLVTPLIAADGEVYAVAQGPVAIAGFTIQGNAGTVTQNTPTNGRIASGAIVEREIDFELESLDSLRLALKNPDFTTSRRIASAINDFKTNVATSESSAEVLITKPNGYKGSIVDLITDIESLTVEPDQIARVVIDEASGIIVIGSEVQVSEVAIAQGNLTIRIIETPLVSQPNAFAAQGDTEVIDRTNIEINTGEDVRLGIVQGNVTLQELVTSLNALGIGPRDMVSILQAVKAAGALQAEIELL